MTEQWWTDDEFVKGLGHGYHLVDSGQIVLCGDVAYKYVTGKIRPAYESLIKKAREGSEWHRDTYVRSKWLPTIDGWLTPDWFIGITRQKGLYSRRLGENNENLVLRIQQQARDGCPVAQKAIHLIAKEKLLGNC